MALLEISAPPEAFVVINGRSLRRENLLNRDMLSSASVKELNRKFREAAPFRHLVLENLFDPELLRLVETEFSLLKKKDWVRYDNASERKLGSRPDAKLGPGAQLYFDLIHSGEFTNFLSAITGIDYLLPDPMLFGGGLHEIPPGGHFAVHIDFNKHPVSRLDNRLVFITYLNRGWDPSYGGALELWHQDGNKKGAEIVPEFGRSILLYQSRDSLHGHPDPVRAPNGRPRRSIAAYFYTNGREDGESADSHTTQIKRPISLSRWGRAVAAVKYITPPVLWDAGRRLRPKK